MQISSQALLDSLRITLSEISQLRTVLFPKIYCFPSHRFSYDTSIVGHNAISRKLLRILWHIYKQHFILYTWKYIYICIYHIYNIYKVSTLWHRIFFFFFLSNKCIFICMCRFQNINRFFHSALATAGEKYHPHSYHYRDSTRVSKTF